ncbi:hypothetical protein, partial [Streptomyces sp. NPDC002922]|uniref:hypothetical protein n=1 Tax=Streptomyces sp. NPDC002922 TaxID=3154439 RepID=UPI0033BB3DE2
MATLPPSRVTAASARFPHQFTHTASNNSEAGQASDLVVNPIRWPTPSVDRHQRERQRTRYQERQGQQHSRAQEAGRRRQQHQAGARQVAGGVVG